MSRAPSAGNMLIGFVVLGGLTYVGVSIIAAGVEAGSIFLLVLGAAFWAVLVLPPWFFAVQNLVRAWVPPNVAKLADREDLRGLARALGHRDAGARRQAATVLAQRHDAATAIALLEEEGGDVEATRKVLATVLGGLDDAEVPRIVEAFREARGDGALAGALAMFDAGGPWHDVLVAASRDPDWKKRLVVAGALIRIGTDPAIDSLVAMLRHDPDAVVRQIVAGHLKESDKPDVVEALRSARDRDAAAVVRAAAAESLGALGQQDPP